MCSKLIYDDLGVKRRGGEDEGGLEQGGQCQGQEDVGGEVDDGEGDDGGGEDNLFVLICFFLEYIVENVSLSFVEWGTLEGNYLV